MPKHAIIILCQGFEEIEALMPIDLLRRANIPVTSCSLTNKEVKGGHGITVHADTRLDSVSDDFDCIILPGGAEGTTHLLKSESVLKLVKQSYEEKKICAAICAAVQVFEKTGIITSKKFTCYPGVELQIPSGIYVKQPVVVDGTLITSQGVGTSIDFSLAIIEHLLNHKTSMDIAQKIIYQ